MKLEGYRETFYTYSGKLSDLNRQLGFAAIALIWLFKIDRGGQLTIPKGLLLPGILVVLSLSFDMLHYCVASVIWRRFYRAKENDGVSEDAEIQHSVWLERPIYALFTIKIVFMMSAYVGILLFLVRTLSVP
jgi:hypothetical protein